MMDPAMSKFKVLMASGIPFPLAVKAALGCTVREFAARNGLVETTVSGVINGSTPYPCENVRDVLATALEVTREEFDSWRPLPRAEKAAA
jgi:transcriptional regulator with XRE-family HTH domain